MTASTVAPEAPSKTTKEQNCYLHLKNGETLTGKCPSWQELGCEGEVVFTTGMTGYPETLTDPSYTGQIINFTYPLIGNYGVPPPEMWESKKIHAKGVIVSSACENWSHHSGMSSFSQWLGAQGVPLITEVDTRALTKLLRTSGTMLGAISQEEIYDITNLWDPNDTHLVQMVSTKKVETYGNEKPVIIAVDCGMKENILRSLCSLPVTVRRVPYDYDFTQEEYDGVFISNGPGDPTKCPETIEIIKKALLQDKPIFGICLGTQMLALAAGAKTYKLPFGHRGQNQPCIDKENGRCYITSQNHGYAVDSESLPEGWKVTYTNLNDGSVEGIAHTSKPFFAVQFHPEAAPGPTDTKWMFNYFYERLRP